MAYINPTDVKYQIDELISQYPDLLEDEILKADMLEGSTDFNELMERCIEQERDAVATQEAIKIRRVELYTRQGRYERKQAAMRKIMQGLMDAADTRKIELSQATISITKARTKTCVDDVDALPQGFFKTERKPLSKEIKAALEAGESIPGATLELGEEGIMVRVK